MIIVFDLNGTLTDPAALGAPWGAPELGLAALSAAVQTGMVDALTHEYRPFAEHMRAALVVEAQRRGLDLDKVDEAVERAASLPPFPDAEAALEHLAGHDHRLAVLTNSGADSGERTLRSAGLAARFERILGVDAVRSYKPHPATYAHAVAAFGVAPGELMLVAAHGWDVTGAKRAGLHTTWIARGEGQLSPAAETPDILAGDLLDAAAQITSI